MHDASALEAIPTFNKTNRKNTLINPENGLFWIHNTHDYTLIAKYINLTLNPHTSFYFFHSLVNAFLLKSLKLVFTHVHEFHVRGKIRMDTLDF